MSQLRIGAGSGIVDLLHICLEINPIDLYLKRFGHPYILRDPLLHPNSVQSIPNWDQGLSASGHYVKIY